MDKEKVKKQAEYWFLTAKHDYDTMKSLFDSRRYSDSLFFAHIVLEKILKSLLVLENEKSAPMIHDLSMLARLAKVNLTEAEGGLLEKMNQFNIRSRYPDYKLNFYKICDRNYTVNYLKKINALYQNLCLNPKLKKLL